MNELDLAREQAMKNAESLIQYHKLINEAEVFLQNNYIEIDQLLERKIGLCDYYRGRHPEKDVTDQEILDHIEKLNIKYEEEK